MTTAILVDLDEYNDLKDNRRRLYALEAAGVGNWEGYDEAMSLYYEENDK